MSLLEKLKGNKPVAPLVPAWHPNFRNFERLPDVKVVRTSFFVNSVAIVLALTALTYFGLQEYNIHDVHVQIAAWQRQIDENQKTSDEAIARYRQFQAEEAKLAEVSTFLKHDYVLSDFIIEIGQTLPDSITLDYVGVQDSGVTLRGAISGTSDEASGKASNYIAQLKADPKIGLIFENISLTGLNRSPLPGQLNFELFLKKKGAK